jgi:cephalosporin-C deacetylase
VGFKQPKDRFMGVFEMPLAKLKKYRGTNPKPKNFEAFWEKSLREMRSLDPKVSLKPNKAISAPYADCFDLTFTGMGGARIHAKYLRPKNIGMPHPALLQFHGYSVNSGDWNDKLGYVAAGFSVAALDCRGQGGSSEDVGGVTGVTLRGHIIRGLDGPPEGLLFRNIFLDTAQLAGIVMGFPEVDEKRVGAMGASQGGGLTLACASLEPRIKKAAPIYPFLSDYRRVWNMDLAKDAYEELTYYFRQFDPRHEREDEVFLKLGYIDLQHLAPRIRAEVLMTTAMMDTVCPPSTQFAAFNKIRSRKHVDLYHDYTHEYIPQAGDRIFNFMMGL